MSSDFYNVKWVRARKEHQCCCWNPPSCKTGRLCRKCIIKPGERYAKIAQVFDGDFGVSVMCRKHNAMLNVAFDAMDSDDRQYGLDYAEVREHLADSLSHAGREGWLRMLHELRNEMRKVAR